MRASSLVAAWTLDWCVGDPEGLPHPVRWLGWLISTSERHLYSPSHSGARKFIAGGVLTATVVTVAHAATHYTLLVLRRLPQSAANAAEILLASTCIASRSLYAEANIVLRALEADDLPRARLRLSRIVGRDTTALETSEVSRALIETLAESASDGIVAPLFYLGLGALTGAGAVPMAMAYKAVNTLDSMIGHCTERYLYFGRVSARLDDVANFLPARLTALSIIVIGMLLPDFHGREAARVWIRDGNRHASPNAGQPEAAAAGALRVRLGGTNTYDGEAVRGAPLGREFPQASIHHVRLALRMIVAVSAAGMMIAVSLTLFPGNKKAHG